MGKINDINLSDWKNSDVWTDSLWLINERDKNGKHDGFYHGNFVPQVPRQLIKKYSKTGDIILDLFLGSGTTAYESETLKKILLVLILFQKWFHMLNQNWINTKNISMNYWLVIV